MTDWGNRSVPSSDIAGRLAALLHRYTGVVALLDVDGNVLWGSPITQLLDFEGRRSAVHPDDAEALETAWQRSLAEQGTRQQVTFRLRIEGAYREYDSAFTNFLHDPMLQAVVLEGFAGDEREAVQHQDHRDDAKASDLLRFSSDAILVIDDTTRVMYASPVVNRMLGYEPEEIVGEVGFTFMHPDDRAAAAEVLAAAAEGVQPPIELRLRHADGHWVPCEIAANFRLDDPTINGVVINVRDITERLALTAGLRDAEVRFEEVFQSAPIGMTLIDREGRILRCNPSFATMLGTDPAGLVGSSLRDLTHPDDAGGHRRIHARLFEGEIPGYIIEKRYRHADGHWIWARVSTSIVRHEGGQAEYAIGQIEDITERKRLLDRLEYEATHDRLTGLASRRLVDDHLRLALAGTERRNTHVGVVFLDLDGFKAVNDTFGHTVGDDVLVAVATTLKQAIRSIDTAGRWGGDEFVVVCPDVASADDAMTIAERVRARLDEGVTVGSLELSMSASLGVSVCSSEVDPASAIRAADLAANRAKSAGGDRTVFYDPRDDPSVTPAGITPLQSSHSDARDSK